MLTRNFFTFVKYIVSNNVCVELKLPFKLKIKYLNANGDSLQGKAVFHEKVYPIKIHAENNEKIIKDRFEIYLKKTLPLLDFYKEQKLLHQINGNVGIDHIFEEIQGIMASLEA